MSTSEIVIAGNPNAGKTSIYNKLTGAAQQVGRSDPRFGPPGDIIDLLKVYDVGCVVELSSGTFIDSASLDRCPE